MAKRKITYQNYLQLLGLVELSKQHNRAIKEIELAVAAITGEERDGDYFGQSSDICWTVNPKVSELLKSLKIEVSAPTAKSKLKN